MRNKEEEGLEDLRIFGSEVLVLTCLKSQCKSQSVLFYSDNCPKFQSALDAAELFACYGDKTEKESHLR